MLEKSLKKVLVALSFLAVTAGYCVAQEAPAVENNAEKVKAVTTETAPAEPHKIKVIAENQGLSQATVPNEHHGNKMERGARGPRGPRGPRFGNASGTPRMMPFMRMKCSCCKCGEIEGMDCGCGMKPAPKNPKDKVASETPQMMRMLKMKRGKCICCKCADKPEGESCGCHMKHRPMMNRGPKKMNNESR